MTQTSEIKKITEQDFTNLDIYRSYKKSPYLSIKHSSYFHTYTELLENYRNKKITFVEIGVFNGGSLFMWRDFFGEQARIIGIDLNPLAKKWEDDGFEIHIGSQSNPNFWQDFFRSVGPVDIVLDDGGHTFEQQIITVDACIPYIKDGGMMIVEDTHTSYFKKFGYPSKYSFIEWSKKIIDNINSRFPTVNVSNLSYKDSIHSITFFESVVGFKIDRRKCFVSSPTSNNGISSNAEDFRHKDTAIGEINEFSSSIKKHLPIFNKILDLKLVKKMLRNFGNRLDKNRLKKLKKFF